jgi:lipoate-protein ligase A
MFMRRDSGGSLILASYHPKWSLTWSWILSVSKHSGGKFLFAYRTYKWKPRGGLYGTIAIGRLRFTRQPTMPRDGLDD